jgi:hypothetical protein
MGIEVDMAASVVAVPAISVVGRFELEVAMYVGFIGPTGLKFFNDDTQQSELVKRMDNESMTGKDDRCADIILLLWVILWNDYSLYRSAD